MREVGPELGDGGSLCRRGADGPETGVEGVRVWWAGCVLLLSHLWSVLGAV